MERFPDDEAADVIDLGRYKEHKLQTRSSGVEIEPGMERETEAAQEALDSIFAAQSHLKFAYDSLKAAKEKTRSFNDSYALGGARRLVVILSEGTKVTTGSKQELLKEDTRVVVDRFDAVDDPAKQGIWFYDEIEKTIFKAEGPSPKTAGYTKDWPPGPQAS